MADKLTFEATRDGGRVSAWLQSAPTDRALIVLGHGAGANMEHAHMQAIADSLGKVAIGSLRFNFPYMERGGGRTDSVAICTETFERALATAMQAVPMTRYLLGGHSFGGRMSSHYAVNARDKVAGLIYFSFPLHPAGKPSVTRAAHMGNIRLPQLFLCGTRDKLAEPVLLRETVSGLVQATLHEIDTADHGFKILKRSRQSSQDVYTEAAAVASDWLSRILNQ